MKFPPGTPRLPFREVPTFRDANCTVRIGADYARKFHDDGHRQIVLLGPGSVFLGGANFDDCFLVPLDLVRQEWINDCPAGQRNLGDLHAHLEALYERTIGADEYVSVIFYTIGE